MTTKTRAEVAAFINEGSLEQSKPNGCREWHVGKVELRQLMDFIYGGEPLIDERIVRIYNPDRPRE
ncbi:MAG: hypothetical protein KAJ73_00510 [Zetaproteobacteria bacterium]|nr:hypothetical protein [Zetaproteobacteria bacterium]